MTVWGIIGTDREETGGLLNRLAEDFLSRGLTISLLREADPAFDVDEPGKDSHRHREAGATEVILASRRHWALMHEARGRAMPDLDTLLAELAPADLILIEGFASGPHPKIAVGDPPKDDPTIRAIAASGTAAPSGLPLFALDDTAAIADFIARAIAPEKASPAPR